MILLRLATAALIASALPSCTPQRTPPALGQADTREIDAISTYLNGLNRFEARFIQTGDLGEGGGLIWLDRPGRLRIDYAGPQASLMVANNGRLAVYDRRTHATTTMAVSRTPLGILLAPVIDLSTDVTILAIQHTEGAVQITLQKTSAPAQGTLTLTLSEPPLALSSVTLVDARRRSLTMTLSDLRTDPAITPDLFAPPAPGS